MKERDALKRAAASAAAGSGAAADGPDARRVEAELKKKDELVTQVTMDAGLQFPGSVRAVLCVCTVALGWQHKLSGSQLTQLLRASTLSLALFNPTADGLPSGSMASC
jgi:hypothetical protein